VTTSPINHNRITLEDLLPNLLSLISRYLSSLDATCLAPCSYDLVNSRSCNELLSKAFLAGYTESPGLELRFVLLNRLSRDLSQYYLYYACLRLHLWQHISLPAPNFKLRNCFDSPEHKDMHLKMNVTSSLYSTYACYPFHFVHLHLAMRRFYFGPSFGIPVETLMYTEVITFPLCSSNLIGARVSEKKFKICQRTGLLSVDAQVCHGPPCLCLRIQRLAVIRRQPVLHLHKGK
jgi:hypothetical protein